MKVALAILGTILGCCANVVILEYMVKMDPGLGNLVTFAQFAFIALEGFIFTSKFGTEPLRIGYQNYIILVVMFFVASVCNNYALDFNIPMPLHMIFRAGSLIANMVMGIVILRKRYDFSKYLSVLMITLGIIVCTFVSGSSIESTANPNLGREDTSGYSEFFWWMCGLSLLTLALFLSARMGIYVEVLYKVHGKHPQEALYITHLLPLPGFLLLYNNIAEHMAIANASEPVAIPVIGVSIPILWICLFANCLTQYLCISSVFLLTTECSSLTVTLIITLRKFISLLFSIVYFNNSFTVCHWIGTFLVFVGTMIFTEMLPLPMSQKASKSAVAAGATDKSKQN
ncbi:UDP-xylose and UDP-N-acetylglucosamine transporter-like [Sitodiplosis mosellana]|uniref:UDP-xylose and UDP-N-acetylglucosamine transporter-like n=1 Tax=Sitodiplosis mosellana TaxID=263140 RepID=UPI00244403C0|nr:UDP-xylose and UDP-N-acetylglucosamine transporter-like [Sitodiplosis mosellana]